MNLQRTLSLLFIGGSCWLSCTQPAAPPAENIATAWSQQSGGGGPRPADYRAGSSDSPSIANRPFEIEEPLIARVHDRPVRRREVVELVMASHGLTVLEQLIGLELARALAAEHGITVSEADIEEETRRALRRLTDPLSPVTDGHIDREEAERLLGSVLAQRNLSREVFRLVMRRNAILRKLVDLRLQVTERQLREEYQRVYGARVKVRHIQVATPGEAMRIQERLAAGEPFAELARRYSANQISAQEGGLLEPFTHGQEDLPAAFREAAFALKPDETSTAVRVGEWYHLIRLEERLPPTEPDFESARADLERRLRDRLADEAMFDLYQRLFREANIEIFDPALRAAFDRKHRQVAEQGGPRSAP